MQLTHSHDEELSDVSHAGHDHASTGNIWQDAWNLFTDPAHFIAEIGFTIVTDVILVFVVWHLLVKGFLLPRLKKQIHREVHEELDSELHIEHTEDGGHLHTECDSEEES